MRKYKTTHKMYSAWNYQREIEDLNRMSEQGWQLLEGRMFSSRFKRNEDVRYRYQIDYQPNLEDRARYIESFREFGWQYVNSTLNGWHYFRKPYDPTLPEEEYEIFSDRSSLYEMNNRWAKLGLGLIIFCSIVAVLELVFMFLHPMLPTLIMLISYAILLVFIGRGVVIMRNSEKSKSRKGDIALTTLFLVVIFGGFIVSNVLMAFRTGLECSMQAEYMDAISANQEDALLWNTFEVEYADNYFIDTEIKTDSPITLTVIDDSGKAVYTVTGDDISEEDVRVVLGRGEYSIYLSGFDGGSLDAEFEMN